MLVAGFGHIAFIGLTVLTVVVARVLLCVAYIYIYIYIYIIYIYIYIHI